MAKQRRSFSVEQKLQIIQEADQHGVTQTLRKHNLSHSVFLRWKHQFDQGGSASLKPQYRKADSELKALQEENAQLKKIIGNQALELEFKTELLKKRGLRPEAQGLVKTYSLRSVPVRSLLKWAGLAASSFYY
jgi:transposase-like protein